jgi:phenylacetate-CoA ligase
MRLQEKVKRSLEKLPPYPGVFLNFLPFSLRLGSDYTDALKLAEKLTRDDHVSRERFIIDSFNKIFSHFRHHNGFYKHLLQQHHCTLESIKSLDDIKNLPVLTKSILKEVPIEERSLPQFCYRQFNTGGTSGSPLSFYLEKNFYAREWAHMHYMWKKIGYEPGKTKITIRGRNIDGVYKYNFNQNEFLINAYHSFGANDFRMLHRVFSKYNTEFIHGYPSAIYSFLREVSASAPSLIDFLRRNIKGIMLASEYPSPVYRDFIEKTITTNTISFYGHTEGVILAAELEKKYEYVPFLSYGYTEAVKKDDSWHLTGTSFYNYAAPFIRYDTEDIIKPAWDEYGYLRSFEISDGRIGEFIQDANRKNISLTALIFGRHHQLFNKAGFVQIKQPAPGEIIVYYSNPTAIENPEALFDSGNLNLKIRFEQVSEPFRTPLGKIPLLIK